MDQKFINQMREKLLADKKNIQEQLSKIADPDKGDHVPGDFAAKFPNYGDDYYTELEDNSPTEVADYSTNLDVTYNLEKRYKSIEAALERIDADTYGYCQKCNAEISVERLQINPASELCIECARQT